MGAPEDILEWSNEKLPPWRQDALRRLANSSVLSSSEYSEVMALLRVHVGFSATAPLPTPIPLSAHDFSTPTAGPKIRLLALESIENVNRLAPNASVKFSKTGITVVYGRNGSGKSGYVRILRSACRTRVENPQKLKVLGNAYGKVGGPQKAKIVVEIDGSEVSLQWGATGAPIRELMHVAVFDSMSALLYVDAGNEIRFLPFGLELPYRLNELCLRLKKDIEVEKVTYANELSSIGLNFAFKAQTRAKLFFETMRGTTKDAEIESASEMTPDKTIRLNEIDALLKSGSGKITELKGLALWLEEFLAEFKVVSVKLSDANLKLAYELKASEKALAKAAGLSAEEIFSGDPLPGLGSDVWKKLWAAARDYSIRFAYVGRDFPVVSSAGEAANCVFCQQSLDDKASERLKRFEAYMSGRLAREYEVAKERVKEIEDDKVIIDLMIKADWEVRLAQVSAREPAISKKMETFKAAAISRSEALSKVLLGGQLEESLAELEEIFKDIHNLGQAISTEITLLGASQNDEAKASLTAELDELMDLNILSNFRHLLTRRRDLLQLESLCNSALSELATIGITKKANELIDTHLTSAVTERYNEERKGLDIEHVNIALSRKSDPTKTLFQTDPNTKLTKLTSEILSEGEQRALALAAFFTETEITSVDGPIVIDDPVSSLDRDRGLKVAARLVAGAKQRQTIVFTHDLIFFNNLCGEAERAGVSLETVALFSDKVHSGKVDDDGMVWKGQSVSKRINKIRADFSSKRKLSETSPAQYSYEIKNLYGRLRDAYERLVEEFIFCEVVKRGSDVIQTQKLRYVHLSDSLAIRFHAGMTTASTHSHDNPESDTKPVPTPLEFEADLTEISDLIAALKKESVEAEKNRPSMKPKS